VSKEGNNSLSNFFSSLDKSSQLAYIISRFYYQILGIYFPAVILVSFFYFYYYDYLTSLFGPIVHSLNSIQFDRWYLTLLVIIGIVVIIGEFINVISSRISFLSPGPIRKVDLFKSIIGIKVRPLWLDKVQWPIWFGISDYPIPFSSFDRYYLESLDKEKRSLAGKIGWTTFFRNMSIVFSIIFLAQVFLFYMILNSQTNILTQNLKLDSTTSLPDFIIHPGKTFFIPLILPLVLAFGFYVGFTSNRRSYDLVFWKSYRRNEFIKWFEAKNGSLQTVFNINSNSLSKAANFVTDTLYYESDQYMRNFSSIILNELETSYGRLREILDNNSNGNVTCSYHKRGPTDKNDDDFAIRCSYCRARIRGMLNDTKTIMNYCYKAWRDGSHEIVLERSFAGLDYLDFKIDDGANDEKKSELEFWQAMRGYLLLSEDFYMNNAYEYITNKLKEWDWINKAAESANVFQSEEIWPLHMMIGIGQSLA